MLRILGDKAPSSHGSSQRRVWEGVIGGGGGRDQEEVGTVASTTTDRHKGYLRAAAEGKCNLKLLTALSLSPANYAEAIGVGTQPRPFSEAQVASWAASGLSQSGGGGGLRLLAESTPPACACEQDPSEVGGGCGGKYTASRSQCRDPSPAWFLSSIKGGRKGQGGPQAPHHQPIKLDSVGQGPAAVTVVPGDPLCTCVTRQVTAFLSLSPDCASAPFFLWSPLSNIAAWVQVCLARGSLLGCPGTACAQPQPLKGRPLGEGMRWPWLSPPRSPRWVWCPFSQHLVRPCPPEVPGLGWEQGWCPQAGRNGCLWASQTLTLGP